MSKAQIRLLFSPSKLRARWFQEEVLLRPGRTSAAVGVGW